MQFFIRLGAVNLLLVSVYLVPIWLRDALRVLNSPFAALHDGQYAVVAEFVRVHFGWGLDGMLILSKALAGLKLLAVAAMVGFLIEFVRAIAERREPDRATVNMVLGLALMLVSSLALPALTISDPEIVRIYATQIMLVSGAAIVTVAERETEWRAPVVKLPRPVLREEPIEERRLAA